ncbi:unnamed protein product [Musa textilis]
MYNVLFLEASVLLGKHSCAFLLLSNFKLFKFYQYANVYLKYICNRGLQTQK